MTGDSTPHLLQEDAERVMVQQFLDGDSGAYDRLMNLLDPMLRSYLKGQIRTRSELDLEDVLQDVRIYLFQRLDRYNPEYPLGVFARGLARNIVKRHLYKKSDLVAGSDSADEEESLGTDLSPLELEKLPPNLRRVVGEGRFESPDGPAPPSREFLELFEAFLRYGGYPHQQVSFGFSILIWGKRKQDGKGGASAALTASKVPITGDPDRVVVVVGAEQLFDSIEAMLIELGRDLGLEEAYLTRVREPVDLRLAMTGGDLFARDKASLKNFDKLSNAVTAQTLLQEYFGKDPRKSVADWTHGVKERVKKCLLDPSVRKRIPLPGL